MRLDRLRAKLLHCLFGRRELTWQPVANLGIPLEKGAAPAPFLAIVLLAPLAFSQSVTLSVSPASLQSGTATLTASFTDSSPSAGMAGVQWVLSLPSGITAALPAAGAATTAAAKIITCGTALCVDIGSAPPNETQINSGVLFTVPLTVSGATPGANAITLTSLLGVSGTGGTNASTINLSVNPATLTILSVYDLNGDGIVNGADVGIMLLDLVNRTCTGQAASVGDGKCDLQAVELEIKAALGVIH